MEEAPHGYRLDGTPKKVQGRPTKLTIEVIELACRYIRGGNLAHGSFYRAVEKLYEAPPKVNTVRDWIQKSKNPNCRGLYRTLHDMVKEAEEIGKTVIFTSLLNRALKDKPETVTKEVTHKLDEDGNQVRVETIIKEFGHDKSSADMKWILARRHPDEFGDRQKVDLHQTTMPKLPVIPVKLLPRYEASDQDDETQTEE